MVGTGRFELPTPRTPSECSTRLSHVPTQLSRLRCSPAFGSKSVYTSNARGATLPTNPPDPTMSTMQTASTALPHAMASSRVSLVFSAPSFALLLAHPPPAAAQPPTASICSSTPSMSKAASPRCSSHPPARPCWSTPAGPDTIGRDPDAHPGRHARRRHHPHRPRAHHPLPRRPRRRRPELVKRVPVGEFLDHGENREDSDITRHDYAAYLKAIEGKPRRIVHPGDTIDLPGLTPSSSPPTASTSPSGPRR